MKIIKSILFFFVIVCVITNAQSVDESLQVSDELKIVKLSDNVLIHISYLDWEGQKVPCNGMVFINNGECIVVDTPVNDEQSKSLIDYLTDKMKLKIRGIIPCHWHVDCMGGLNEFHKNNIPSYSYKLTAEIAVKKHLHVPQNIFEDSLAVKFGNENVVAKYFGGGHTIDNIVVWFPSEKVLFGGCLIKAMNSDNLGNTADAVVGDWDNTVQKVKKSFPDAKIIVPGHGAYGRAELLDHTIQLVINQKENN